VDEETYCRVDDQVAKQADLQADLHVDLQADLHVDLQMSHLWIKEYYDYVPHGTFGGFGSSYLKELYY